MSKIISTTIVNPSGKEDTCALVQVNGQELYYLLRPIEVIGRYTISFWIKAQANETVVVHYGEQTKSANVTTSWQRVIFSFNAEHIDNVMIQFTTGNYYIYNTQLENGDVATDYNISPDDMEKQLADIQEYTNKQYSEVVQSLNSYKVEVGKTYATKDSVNEDISKLTLDLNGFKTEVSKTYTTQTDFQKQIDNLQQQIDGAVETFSGAEVPTLTNKPAVDWTTDAIKDTHIGDLYVVSAENTEYGGFYYRFEKVNSVYQWTLLADTEVTKALEEARKANEKAEKAQKELDDLKNNLETNYSTTVNMESAIEQSANSILQTVSGTYATQESVKASLELKVGVDDNDKVVSMINASADEISIKSNRLSIESDNFTLTKDGVMKSIAGEIGGWNVTELNIEKTFETIIAGEPVTYKTILDTELQFSGTYLDYSSGEEVTTKINAGVDLDITGLIYQSSTNPWTRYPGLHIWCDEDLFLRSVKSNVAIWGDKIALADSNGATHAVVENGDVVTLSGASLNVAYNKIAKSLSVDAVINVTANSFAYKDITWTLPEGATFLGLSYVIIDRGGSWSSLASVSHQTITNSGCRLIVAANTTGNYTVRTYVYYK